MRRKWIWVAFLAIGMSPGLMASTAAGGMITLTDGNSTVTIDPTSSLGMESWQINGVNQLAQQWFWYRIGGGTGAASSIDTLGLSSTSTAFGTRGAAVVYSNSSQGLSVEVDYLLTGGAPSGGNADMSESIRLTNTLSTPLTVDFFQYSNFNLNGASQDTVSFPNADTVTQSNAASSLTETVVNPNPNYWEGNFHPNTLNEFGSPSFTHLSDNPALGSGSVGPGNVTWAYEWDTTIPPGQTFIISKDKRLNVVPEPSTLALLLSAVLGAIACAWRRRRAWPEPLRRLTILSHCRLSLPLAAPREIAAKASTAARRT